jgi:hypothetical protein
MFIFYVARAAAAAALALAKNLYRNIINIIIWRQLSTIIQNLLRRHRRLLI